MQYRIGKEPFRWFGPARKSDFMTDPIASDPNLLWFWTRIVAALVVILAFAVGMDEIGFQEIAG